MTHDEIIKLVDKAGISQMTWFHNWNEIERFAALVVAAEREACAKYVAESFGKELVDGQDVAAAIRARGEQEQQQ